MRLVVDLGGTNCRVALVPAKAMPPEAIESFANDAFASFMDLLDHYLARKAVVLTEMVVAVAGPVGLGARGQIAKITNRDWLLSASDLSARFGKIPVHLMNDLSALGYGLAALSGEKLIQILPAANRKHHPQSLVIGIGTGFNISPVLTSGRGVSCLVTEYGHVGLPLDVHQAMAHELGSEAAQFVSVEDCFSGRGFEQLHAAFCQKEKRLSGARIIASAQHGDQQALAFTAFYARLLALLGRNLRKGFLPRGGMYFAGSVARGVLTSPAQDAFVAEFSRQETQIEDIIVPVFCILDDHAALSGCADFSFSANS